MKSERSETPPVCLNFQKPLLNGAEWRENSPGICCAWRNGKRPQSHIPNRHRQGDGEKRFDVFIPEEYGGAGLSVLDYVVALEEICYADAGVGVIMSVNNSLVCWPVWKFEMKNKKQKYLAPMASGKSLAATPD